MKRALYTLEHQVYDGDFEIIVIDDGSEYDLLPTKLVQYERLRPYGSPPRQGTSGGAVYRKAYEKARGDFIILTDSDILVPPNGVESLVRNYGYDGRIAPIVFGLDWEIQKKIDTFPWRTKLNAFMDADGFWSFMIPQGVENRDSYTVRHHLLFSGQRRDLWEETGLFDNTVSIDTYVETFIFHHTTRPIMQVPINVYHQWHERGTSYSARIKRIRNA
jgi:glycosyltransferase involved in cell wall biosynthesis